MAHILLVLSASDHWTLKDGSAHRTGYWAEELVVPHRTFTEREVQLTIATPGGGSPVVDPASLTAEMNGGDEDKVEALRRYLDAHEAELRSPTSLEDAAARTGDFDAVYIPGGHAPMEDLPGSVPLGRILDDLDGSGRVVAAMCHGPAGLLAARRPDGGWRFAGRRVTGFTDEEERQVGLADKAAWRLEDRLRREGGRFEAAAAWESHVIADGTLITGQNPASSQAAADATLAALAALQR